MADLWQVSKTATFADKETYFLILGIFLVRNIFTLILVKHEDEYH